MLLAVMSGRKSDVIWHKFKKIVTAGKTGCQALCNTCGEEMQGIVERMKRHVRICQVPITAVSMHLFTSV